MVSRAMLRGTLLLAVCFGTTVALSPTTAAAGPSIRGGKARAITTPGASRPGDTNYFVPYVTGPGGHRVPVMDIPGSVTVVPRSLMDDQQATTVGEALRYVPGVFVSR